MTASLGNGRVLNLSFAGSYIHRPPDTLPLDLGDSPPDTVEDFALHAVQYDVLICATKYVQDELILT